MFQSCFKQPAPFYANSTSYQLSKPDVGFIEGEYAKKVRVSLWLQSQGNAKGTVLLQPGRTEPIEKHIESVSDFYKRGFSVAMFDWQGQGLSDRLLVDSKKGHIDNFETYDANYSDVVKHVYNKHCPKPWIAVGHSMGGALSLSAAYKQPDFFDALILCAPMLSIKANPILLNIAPYLTRFVRALGLGNAYFSDANAARLPHDLGFDYTYLTSSTERFEGFIEMIAKAPHLGVASPTYRWVSEALKRIHQIQHLWDLKTIKMPALLFSPQDDKLVDSAINEHVFNRLPKGKIIQVKGSGHELLMERDCYRELFWISVDDLLKKV